MSAAAMVPAPERSLAERLALRPAERRRFLRTLGRKEAALLEHDWRFWGRPSQQAPPGDWFLWYIVAGRAWGKNRTAANWLHDRAERTPGSVGFIAGRTARDVRDTIVFHPRSGLIATQRPWNPCEWKPSQSRVVYRNGSELRMYSSEEPDQARGPEHDFGYGDEFATWKRVKDVQGNTLYDNLLMGLRGGANPQALFTSTPRPVKLVKDALEAGERDPSVVVTRGALYDNAANLSPQFVDFMRRKYAGTRLERQELFGELLDAIEGALWQAEWFEDGRVEAPPELRRVVVSVDPAVSTEEQSNRTGIVGVGRGSDDHGYALARRSGVFRPAEWARRAVDLYHELSADCVVAEVNNGGDLVEAALKSVDRNVPVVKVRASRGKAKRAQPVAALYEQGRFHHVGPAEQWVQMEHEMTLTDAEAYQGDGSPDDMDALVWGAFELFHLAGEEMPAADIA